MYFNDSKMLSSFSFKNQMHFVFILIKDVHLLVYQQFQKSCNKTLGA